MKFSFMWVDKTLPKEHPVTGSKMNLREFAKLLSVTGYNGIEIMMGNPFMFDYEDVKNVISETNLQISQLCTGEFFNFYGLCLNHKDQDKYKEALLWAEEVINLASQFKCSMNIGRFRGKIWQDGHENSFDRMINSFKHLDQKAQEKKVTILIEPLRKDICDNLNSVLDTYNFLKKFGLQSFHLMIDTDHTLIEEKEYVNKYSSSIKYIHLADTKHVPIGEGIIQFSEYFNLFKSIGYHGYMSIEVFSENRDKEIIKKSMAYLEKFFYKDGIRWVYTDDK